MLFKRKGIVLFALGFTGFSFFYILPYFYSLYFAFIDNTFNRSFVGFRNFTEVLSNKYFCLALVNTFEFTLIATPVLVMISFILAIVVHSKGPGCMALRFSAIIPVLLPSAAVVMVWNLLFGEDSIIINQLISLSSAFIDENLKKIPIYLFFIWKNTGLNIILFLAGFSSVPGEIYESSEIDGAKGLQKHMYITFPLLLPTIFFVFVISIISTFKIFKEVYLLYGSYPADELYFVQHFMNNHFFKLNYQYLSTGAVIFCFIVYIIVAMGYRVENNLSKGVW